jgi:outer membrane protein assembly factor BamB
VRQILIVNQDAVAGHDATTGFLLWRFPWPGKTDSNANIAQAFGVDKSRVFVSKSYGTGAALFNVTHDGVGNWGTKSEPLNGKNAWAKPVLKTKLNNLSRFNNLLFGLDEEILSCVDLETGQKYWKDRKAGAGQGQILLVGDLLLVQTEDGQLLLVEATSEKYKELGRIKAIDGQPCWNPPAFAPPYFLIRNHREVACFELPLEKSSEKSGR